MKIYTRTPRTLHILRALVGFRADARMAGETLPTIRGGNPINYYGSDWDKRSVRCSPCWKDQTRKARQWQDA